MPKQDGMAFEPVILNVYDMIPVNDYAKLFGFGVFHTGVEVYGNEYAYGGHLSAFTGIYDMHPKDSLVLGEDFKFRQSIILGYTPLRKEEVQQLVSHLGVEYSGNRYSIVSKNCNHFTKEFCLMLCGKTIPRWVNRLADGVSHVPFLRNLVERSMGIPTMISQCCGSGMIDPVDPTLSQENAKKIEESWSVTSSDASNENMLSSSNSFIKTTSV